MNGKDLEKLMKNLNKDLFVLVIGIAGGGTSATRGLINLSSQFNIAFEKRQDELNDTLKCVRKRMETCISFPDKFNGNKIALNRNIFEIKNLIECIEKRKLIMSDNFLRLKIVFVDRNPIDTVCSTFFKRILLGKSRKYRTLSEAIDNWLVRKEQI